MLTTKRARSIAKMAKGLERNEGLTPEAASAEAERRVSNLEAYWAGSITASVMADYAVGNVTIIRV